ncbi:MAG TPA: CotH kinase family protein, partial [Saprospiraceae bacterium]|nr:CotH kinase family protein [Saprospiraceae bacterium]
VCKDWLNWNTAWWRGRNPAGGAKRWRYALWDMDATFGHYINYTNIPDIGPTADPCDVEEIPNSGDPQNHIDIFMALYANPDFKTLYINRYADLLNTFLSCDYMNALLDSMTNVIAPEMAQHCARWGGTVGQWQQHVDAIHDFINTRCQLIDQSIADCYDVSGPFGLTVQISPAGSPNQVMVNTITPGVYPFVAEYFGGLNIDLVAKAAPGWVFDHWEVSGNVFGPNQNAEAISMAFQTTGIVTAFFTPTGPCSEPSGLAVANPVSAPSVNWISQQYASGYHILYRKVGDPVWTDLSTTQTTWDVNTLPGCTSYEMQIQSVCPQGNSAYVDFAFATPDRLLGFEPEDAVICNSGTAVLDATLAGAGYQWYDGSNTSTHSVAAAGQYWVTVNLDGCSATDTIQVSQIDATSAVQPKLCPGEAYLLAGETFDEQHPTGQVILANMAASGCDSIINVSLTYWATSQSQVVTTSCDPAAVGVDTLVLSSVAGCDSLVITNTTLAPTSQTFLSAASCNPNLVGTDTLILSNSYGCDSLIITTTTFDPTAVAITPIFVQNCDPAAVGVDTLVLSSVAGCDSLVITNTTLAPTSQTFLSAASCNPNLVGTDTLILSNSYGCDSLIITTTTFSGLDFQPSAQDVFCFGGKDGMIQIDTVLTSFVPVSLALGNYPARLYTGTPIVWENLPAGVYSLVATNSEGCTMAREVGIAEGNVLHLDFAQTSIMLHLGDSTWVEPATDFQIEEALWTPSLGVKCDTCPGTYLSPERSGQYTLTVFDENGCSTSASLSVRVEQGVRVYVANAIRPDSDGPNASLTVFTGPEVSSIRWIQLFDRWGNKLFEQKDPPANVPSAWDGKFRGEWVPPGVLVWVCELETVDGRVLRQSGDIMVVR